MKERDLMRKREKNRKEQMRKREKSKRDEIREKLTKQNG